MFNILQIFVDRTATCSYDDQSPGLNISDLFVRRPVDNVPYASHQDLDVNIAMSCAEQSLRQRREPSTVPDFRCTTFVLQHPHVLEEFGSPKVADVGWCVNKPEISSMTTGFSPEYHSQLHFPRKFDNHTNDSCYRAPCTLNTDAVSAQLEDGFSNADVYCNITNELENINNHSLSSVSGLGNTVCSLGLQSSYCNYSVNAIIPRNYSNYQRADGFRISPPQTPCNLFNNGDQPVTSYQTLKYRDFSEDPTLPPRTTGTWSENHSSVTENVSEQTCVSRIPEQITSLKTVPDYQQQNGIYLNQRQAARINKKDSAYTTRFKTLCRFDIPTDLISTPPQTTRNSSQVNSVVTADLSKLMHVSSNESNLTSVVPSCPNHVISSGKIARPQLTCRRRLFSDTNYHRIDDDYKVCRKPQQEQGAFYQSPPPTRCTLLDSENGSCVSRIPEQITSLTRTQKVKTVPDYQQQNGIYLNQRQAAYINKKDSADTTTFKTLCRFDISTDLISTPPETTRNSSQVNSVVTPDLSIKMHVSSNENNSTYVVPSCPNHVISSGKIAGPQLTCRRRLFRDTNYHRIDDDYKVCRKPQQEQDAFYQSPPPTPCTLLDSENGLDKPFDLEFSKESTPPTPARGSCCKRHSCVTQKASANYGDSTFLAYSSSQPVFSTGEVGKSLTSCRRRLFDCSGCNEADKGYRLLKRSHDILPHSQQRTVYEEDNLTTTTSFQATSRPNCSDHYQTEVLQVQKADEGHGVRKKSAAAVHRYDSCGRVYTRRSTLRDHVLARHSMTPRRHVCPICQRQFTQPSNLTAHQRIHTGICN